MPRVAIALLTIFSSFAFSASPDLTSLAKLLPDGSQFAVTVIDSKTGKTTLSYNENLMLTPASTQKIVTSLAAALYLPKNFAFKTELYRSEKDLILTFGGDPTLLRQDLKRLLAKLKQQKINQVHGNIWLDTSIFASYDKAPGWPWDSLGVCYSAPATAVSLEENCFHATMYSDLENHSTRVYVPPHQPVLVTSLAKAVTDKEQEKQHCELDIAFNRNNNYQLSGCISTENKPLPLQFAIQNPAKYTAEVIVQLLKELNIGFEGKVRFAEPIPASISAQKKYVASHFSAPRDELLTQLLKDSKNLVTDNLLKIIGQSYYKSPGTFRNGVSAVKEIIKQKTTIDLNDIQMVDGSGLSRDNRISSAKMGEVLLWLYQNPNLGLIKMLPIAGVDGTLKYRPGVRYQPVQNNLQSKSGSLYGTHNLAGVLRKKQGDLLVIQFVSGYFVSKEQQKLDKENKKNMPIAKFEKALYESLLK